MRSKVFEYLILLHPSEDEKGKTKVIVEKTTLLASDLDVAKTLVARAIPEEFLEELENVEVLIRPF